MTLFTGLSEKFEMAITEPEAYLGKVSTRLKLEKQAVVSKLLGIKYSIARPNPLGLNNNDTDAVYRFVAAENLECAFNCDPQTDTEIVRVLARIVAGSILEGEHIHISIHPSYQKAKTVERKPNEMLLAYFEVAIRDFPQDVTESCAILDEFREIHNCVTRGSSHQ